MNEKEIIKQVHELGIVITGQTGNLVPMDKVVYALRDVTATVSSIPLIASSIMSKKIAAGADKILIDIKVGNGALLNNKEDAKKLSDLMIKIGEFYGREVRTTISDMNTPLGRCVGNALEVKEALDVLRGRETDNNLTDLCIDLSTDMVSMGLQVTKKQAKEMVLNTINNGSAYMKFLKLIEHQKGDISKLKVSEKIVKVKSTKDGIVKKINALELGKLSLRLGAGKENMNDKIDYGVGVKLLKLVGDEVKNGDVLFEMYVGKKEPQFILDDIYKIE